jgi:hypothetical protein
MSEDAKLADVLAPHLIHRMRDGATLGCRFIFPYRTAFGFTADDAAIIGARSSASARPS